MAHTRKLHYKDINAAPETYVGNYGDLWFDPMGNVIRVYNGQAGGHTIGGGSTGTSWDLTSQGNGCPINVTLTTTTFDVQVPKNHLFFRDDGSWDIGSYFNGTYITGSTSGSDTVVIATGRGDCTWTFDQYGNLTFPTPGNNSVSNSVGYLGLPQHSYTAGTYNVHNYDQGKHIYLTNSPTATFKMTSNTDIPFPVGTTMMIVTGGSTTASIQMAWANGGDSDQIIQAVTGTVVDGSGGSPTSFTLAPYGMATLLKIGTTTWMISGAGLS